MSLNGLELSKRFYFDVIKPILENNKGNTPVFLSLGTNGVRGSLYSLKEYRVKVSEDLIKEVTTLLGAGSLRLNA